MWKTSLIQSAAGFCLGARGRWPAIPLPQTAGLLEQILNLLLAKGLRCCSHPHGDDDALEPLNVPANPAGPDLKVSFILESPVASQLWSVHGRFPSCLPSPCCHLTLCTEGAVSAIFSSSLVVLLSHPSFNQRHRGSERQFFSLVFIINTMNPL